MDPFLPPSWPTELASRCTVGAVLVLPFLDAENPYGPFLRAKDTYKQYNFQEPWNGTINGTVLLGNRSRYDGGSIYSCLSDNGWRQTPAIEFTSYFAVVGSQAAWRGSKPIRLSKLPEGGRRMILLVEADNRGINWKEPRDLTYEEAALSIPSMHELGHDYFHHARRGAYAAFVDGTVHFLPEDIAPEDLRALLTGDLSRNIDLQSLDRPSLDWSHVVALPLLIVSGAVLIIGSLVRRGRAGEEADERR